MARIGGRLALALCVGLLGGAALPAPPSGASPIDVPRAEAQRSEPAIHGTTAPSAARYEQIEVAQDGAAAAEQEVTDAEATSADDNGLRDQSAEAKGEPSEQPASFEPQQEQSQFVTQVNAIGRLVAEEPAMRAAAQTPRVTLTGPTEAIGPESPTRLVVAGLPEVLAPPGSENAAPVLPPSRSAAVVAYVTAQLGKPYCYAGAGPGCFDCSGLTMQAWAQVGVYMAHNSEAQYAAFQKVPMNALQPGDIVWNPGHVGIYVGDGAVIHAPHEGDVVRYISVDYFQAAVRPA